MKTGETRWVYVTFAASSLTSGFVSLMFKKPTDTIQLTVGRCGFTWVVFLEQNQLFIISA